MDPSQSTLLFVRLLFAILLLILSATTPAARLVLLVSTATIEMTARSLKKKQLLRCQRLIVYLVLFPLQYFLVKEIEKLTVTKELEIRGLAVPPKG